MESAATTLFRGALGIGIEAIAAVARRVRPKRPHPFLTGLHAPMHEELTLTDLPVTGTIPAALSGRYLRNGPNPVQAESAGYHWFVGDGMVHGIALKDGRALWYRNRWIRSAAVAKAIGVPAAPGPRHDFDTVNTNVVPHAGKAWALVEAGSFPVAVGPTLEEQRYDPFGGTLRGSFSAHPHRDPLTGELHAICYEAKRPETIRHVVVDAGGRVVREEPVAVRDGPLIHDCAITARYAIILDLPVTLSVTTLMAGHLLPYRWNPRHPARIGLMPRDGSAADVVWCAVDPAFVFHVANAFDLPDGRVALDVCAYATMFAGEPGGPDALPRGLERWTLDPARRTVEVRTLDASPQEFPRPDERRFGQPYRYCYTLALEADDPMASRRLFKHDLDAGTREVHDFGVGRHPGEFVFVPARPDAAEDEGWLIGLVIDANRGTTDLAILNAQRIANTPVALVHLPHRVPPGFHGNWFADAD